MSSIAVISSCPAMPFRQFVPRLGLPPDFSCFPFPAALPCHLVSAVSPFRLFCPAIWFQLFSLSCCPALLSTIPTLALGTLGSQTRTNPSSDDVSSDCWDFSLEKETPVTGPLWPLRVRSSAQLPALPQSYSLASQAEVAAASFVESALQ